MPVARNVAAPPATNLIGPGVDPAAGSAAANTTADGDGDIEGDVADDKLYCWCNTTSFGVMVACDDRTCPREWVRSFSIFRFACGVSADDVAPTVPYHMFARSRRGSYGRLVLRPLQRETKE